MRGLFVTGSDTGAGKTVVAAAIVAALRARGAAVAAIKPVLTGLDEVAAPDWPADHELLARAAGCAPSEVVSATFGPAVSPHLAASLCGGRIDPGELVAWIERVAEGHETAVVEGVGGLLVPLTDEGFCVRELARELALPLIVAARPGLGTINHTLLTLEAARAAELEVAAVVLTPWPACPDRVARSNRETIGRLGEVEVAVLDALPRADPRLLAAAGARLSVGRWLARSPALTSGG